MKNSINKPPVSFWLISIAASIWYSVGLIYFSCKLFMIDDLFNSLTKAEQNYFEKTYFLVTILFGIFILTGFLGSLSLLFRKKDAIFLFRISIVAFVPLFIHHFFLVNFIELSGLDIVRPILILFISGFLLWYTNISFSNKWIIKRTPFYKTLFSE